MADLESSAEDKAFLDMLAYARRVLEPRVERRSVWPMLGAAGFCAVCALTFAAAAILDPPAELSHPSAMRGAY